MMSQFTLLLASIALRKDNSKAAGHSDSQSLHAKCDNSHASYCRKGIHTRFEYWGLDVNHDWPWWHKMVQTYLPWLLG